MRTARWRWLVPVVAALLVASGAVPTSSGAPAVGVAAAVAGHDRAAPDGAVRPGIADRVDRATPVERVPGTPPASVPVSGGNHATSIARPAGRAVAASGLSATGPRAPPDRTAPMPS